MATTERREQRPAVRKPGWMSIPGGPKVPDRSVFFAKLRTLKEEKGQLLDRLKAVRESFYGRDEGRRSDIDDERARLRGRMNEIDANRRAERDARREKEEQIQGLRRKREAIQKELDALSNELGPFRDLEDIEAAIDIIMYRAETGKGGLKSEKATLKRLSQLEQAKSLILRLQPLTDDIAELEDTEIELQREYREIHERIGALNKEYEEEVSVKTEKDKEARKQGADRGAIMKEIDGLRQRINKVYEEIAAAQTAFETQEAEFAVWKEKAIVMYREQMEAQQREREAFMKEREAKLKAARRAQRALKRLNPYENEIDACVGLIHYLEDKVNVQKKDKQREIERLAAKKYAERLQAKDGQVPLLLEVEDPYACFSVDKKKQQKQQKQQQKSATSQAVAETQQSEQKERVKYLQHNAEKYRQFEFVKIDIPLMYTDIAATIDVLKKKKAEYESHIVEGEAVESSEDENEAPKTAGNTSEANAEPTAAN